MAQKLDYMPDALKYYNQTIHASSEDDLDFLIKILQPSDDRKEMGSVYESVLGYNPITHFDNKFLQKIYRNIIEDAPDSLKDELCDPDTEIGFIEAAIASKESTVEDHLMTLLAQEIYEETGWWPSKITKPKILHLGEHEINTKDDALSFEDEEDESDEDEEVLSDAIEDELDLIDY